MALTHDLTGVPLKTFWKNNALSIVLLLLFLVFWTAQTLTGWEVHNLRLRDWHQRSLSLGAYLSSGHFWSSTAENWESEFLQMAAFVAFTIYLRQCGSAESNPYSGEMTQKERDQERRDNKMQGFWRPNGLTVTLLGLFLFSFTLHLFGSWRATTLEDLAKGQNAPILSQFLSEPEFWFESFHKDSG